MPQGTHTITHGGSCSEDIIDQQECFSVQIGAFSSHNKNSTRILNALQGRATGLRGIVARTFQDGSTHRYACCQGNSTGYPLGLIVTATPLSLAGQWHWHDVVSTASQARSMQMRKGGLSQTQSNRRAVAIFEKNEEIVEIRGGIVIKRTACRLHIMSVPQTAQQGVVPDVVTPNLLQTAQANIAQGILGSTQFRIAHRTVTRQKQVKQCRPKTHPACRSSPVPQESPSHPTVPTDSGNRQWRRIYAHRCPV